MLSNMKFGFFISLIGLVSSTETNPLHHYLKHDNSIPSNTFRLELRDTPTPTLNLSSMPSCVQANCLPSPSPTLACSPIPTTCPDDAPSGTKTCTTYPLSCYCTVPTPLSCAFHPCSWYNWGLTEDWFTALCPNVRPIDYSPLPSCAKQCIEDSAFDYGCITSSTTCFCTHGSLFGCDLKCKKETEKEELVQWFMGQCAATRAEANGTLGDDGAVKPKSTDAPLPVLKGRKLRWYEVMAVGVGVVTFLAFVGGMVALWVFDRVRVVSRKKGG